MSLEQAQWQASRFRPCHVPSPYSLSGPLISSCQDVLRATFQEEEQRILSFLPKACCGNQVTVLGSNHCKIKPLQTDLWGWRCLKPGSPIFWPSILISRHLGSVRVPFSVCQLGVLVPWQVPSPNAWNPNRVPPVLSNTGQVKLQCDRCL